MSPTVLAGLCFAGLWDHDYRTMQREWHCLHPGSFCSSCAYADTVSRLSLLGTIRDIRRRFLACHQFQEGLNEN